MRKLWMVLLVALALTGLATSTQAATPAPPRDPAPSPSTAPARAGKSQFVDMGEMIIEGTRQSPSGTWVMQRPDAPFGRLSSMKRSFLRELMRSGRDPALR